MEINDALMAGSFAHPAVVLDWFSRRVLWWRVSTSMEAAFYMETMEDALAKRDEPDIFNIDMHASDSVSAACDGSGRYLDLHSRRRRHSALDARTPDHAYFRHMSMPPIRLAA